MTNAELIAKIKAEIERRIKLYSVTNEKEQWIINTYWSVLSFLDTLESKKPMNLDLEIEIEDYVEQKWQFIEDLNAAVPVYLYDMTLDELKDCARHFAQWGAEHTPLPEDTVLFNKGVEEGKRLMMEEAVEGEVMLNPYPIICLDDCKDYDFKDGDKVKIIIIKEEENGQSD